MMNVLLRLITRALMRTVRQYLYSKHKAKPLPRSIRPPKTVQKSNMRSQYKTTKRSKP